jgi:hypothetical protein
MALAAARIKPRPSHLFFFAFFAFLPRVVQITLLSPTYYEHWHQDASIGVMFVKMC